jgi:hypothetical protein
MEWIKKNMISLIGWFVVLVAGLVWGLIQKGAETEAKEHVVQIVTELVNSKDFMDNAMNTDYMKKYKTEEKLKTMKEVVQVVNEEGIDLLGVISLKTGKTKEACADSLARRIDFVCPHQQTLSPEQEDAVVKLIRLYNRRAIQL